MLCAIESSCMAAISLDNEAGNTALVASITVPLKNGLKPAKREGGFAELRVGQTVSIDLERSIGTDGGSPF